MKSNVIPLSQYRERQQEPARPTGELTLETIRNTPAPTAGRLRLSCPVLRGFFVRITARNARSYYVEARVRNGKQRQVRLGDVDQMDIRKARAMAKDFIADAHSRDQHGRGVDISTAAKNRAGLTLRQAWDLLRKQRKYAPRTIIMYERALVQMGWADRDLWSITKADVVDCFLRVSEKHGATQASQAFRFVATVWKYHAADLPVPLASPTAVLGAKRLWPKPTRKTRLISAEDFPAWWQSFSDGGDGSDNGVWALYFRALALTGCRRTEMLYAEWQGYDAKRHELHFPATVTKNKKAHTIPVGPALAVMLKTHRATQEKGVRFIFATPAGQRLSAQSVSNAFIRHHRAHGGPKWSAHDLRRTYLTVGDSINVPRGVLKALVNHTMGDVTDGYIHPEDLRKHQERMEAAILARAKVQS
jgi:integrase